MAPAKPIGTLHFIVETAYKADKARIAAKFNGLALDTRKFDAEKVSKKPDFISENPFGKVPYLETEMGCICTSNAIARFIARCRADTSLYGRTFAEEGQIDTWMEFCTHELEIPLMSWVYPVMGLMEDIPASTKQAQTDVRKALSALEEQLEVHPFLIGDHVTLADIVIVFTLREGFTRVLDPSFRKPFPKVCAWFETCCRLPQFKAILGDVELCTQAAKPQPVLPAFQPVAREVKAKPAAKESPDAKAIPTVHPDDAKKDPATKTRSPASDAIAGGASEADIKAVGDKIRELKEKLKGEGLSGKKINEHDEVKRLVVQLQELKARAEATPAAPVVAAAIIKDVPPTVAKVSAPPATTSTNGDVDAQIKAVGDQIRQIKEKLKAEGLSGKQINENGEVKMLVSQLQELKSQSTPPSVGAPTSAAKPAPAPAQKAEVASATPPAAEKPASPPRSRAAPTTAVTPKASAPPKAQATPKDVASPKGVSPTKAAPSPEPSSSAPAKQVLVPEAGAPQQAAVSPKAGAPSKKAAASPEATSPKVMVSAAKTPPAEAVDSFDTQSNASAGQSLKDRVKGICCRARNPSASNGRKQD